MSSAPAPWAVALHSALRKRVSRYSLRYQPGGARQSHCVGAKNLQFLVDKQRYRQKKEIVFNRIQFISDINQCKADVIIEAIIEKRAKVSVFNQLAAVNSGDTILPAILLPYRFRISRRMSIIPNGRGHALLQPGTCDETGGSGEGSTNRRSCGATDIRPLPATQKHR